jgi:hypothetical protein
MTRPASATTTGPPQTVRDFAIRGIPAPRQILEGWGVRNDRLPVSNFSPMDTNRIFGGFK